MIAQLAQARRHQREFDRRFRRAQLAEGEGSIVRQPGDFLHERMQPLRQPGRIAGPRAQAGADAAAVGAQAAPGRQRAVQQGARESARQQGQAEPQAAGEAARDGVGPVPAEQAGADEETQYPQARAGDGPEREVPQHGGGDARGGAGLARVERGGQHAEMGGQVGAGLEQREQPGMAVDGALQPARHPGQDGEAVVAAAAFHAHAVALVLGRRRRDGRHGADAGAADRAQREAPRQPGDEGGVDDTGRDAAFHDDIAFRGQEIIHRALPGEDLARLCTAAAGQGACASKVRRAGAGPARAAVLARRWTTREDGP
jgi:hypothetical protein